MLAEGDDDRLVFNREHRGLRILRSSRQVSDGCARFPLRDGLRVDAVALGEAPQALLTMLYRSTDRLCRCGAAVKNLAHSASLHDNEKTAPSKPGIKHLADRDGDRSLGSIRLGAQSRRALNRGVRSIFESDE